MFKIGDRVKLNSNHSISFIPKGARGTITKITSDRIIINFDKYYIYRNIPCYHHRVEKLLQDGHQLLLFEVE